MGGEIAIFILAAAVILGATAISTTPGIPDTISLNVQNFLADLNPIPIEPGPVEIKEPITWPNNNTPGRRYWKMINTTDDLIVALKSEPKLTAPNTWEFKRKGKKQKIRLNKWRDGIMIATGENTTYWISSTDCTINTTRHYEDENIIYTCDVTVTGDGELHLTNVTFEWNGTYDVTVNVGGIMILNESSLWRDYGGSGTNTDGIIHGTLNASNSQIDAHPQDIQIQFWNGTSTIDNCDWGYGDASIDGKEAKVLFKNMENSEPYYFDIFSRDGVDTNVTITNWERSEVRTRTVFNTSDGGFLRVENSEIPNYPEMVFENQYTYIKDSELYKLEFGGSGYQVIVNSTISYLSPWYNTDTFNFTKPYSGVDWYYVRPSAGFEVHGYIDVLGAGYWSTSNFKRYYPFNVTDESGVPQNNVNISLKEGATLSDYCLTNANGYCEAFHNADDDANVIEIYVNDVFEANMTPINDTHPDGIMIEVSGVADEQPPNITYEAPTPNNEIITANYTYINISINETGSCLLDWNGTNESMSGSGQLYYQNKTEQGNGNYTFSAWCNDTTGNLDQAPERWVYINWTAPVCTPNWTSVNTSYSAWTNDSCNTSDQYFGWRYFTEWFNDTESCGDTPPANNTYYDNQTFSCNYCSYEPTNSSWAAYQNTSCNISDQLTNWSYKIEYDANYSTCYALTSLPSDLWNSGDNITWYDNHTLGCDFCTPNITNTTWSAWINQTGCLITDNTTQNRSRYDYDVNYCYAQTGLAADNHTNTTYWEYQNISCNYCSCNITGPFNTTCNVTGQLTEYYIDVNYASCCAVTAIPADCIVDNGSYDNVTHNCTYDSFPPNITYEYPTPNNETVTTNSVTINVSINETGSCLLDWNGTNESMSGSGTLFTTIKSSLTNGTYNFLAWCNDTMGNLAAGALRYVNISYSPPPPPTLPANWYRSIWYDFYAGEWLYGLIYLIS